MKKLYILITLFIILFFSNCSLLEQKASVRFQNATSDIAIYYGIGLGDAKYNGYFAPGNVTEYYETEAGTYSVQLKNASGSWITDSIGSFIIESNHNYSVTILGSLAGGYSYYLTLDQ